MFKKGNKKGLSRGREFIGGCVLFFNCGTEKFAVFLLKEPSSPRFCSERRYVTIIFTGNGIFWWQENRIRKLRKLT